MESACLVENTTLIYAIDVKENNVKKISHRNRIDLNSISLEDLKVIKEVYQKYLNSDLELCEQIMEERTRKFTSIYPQRKQYYKDFRNELINLVKLIGERINHLESVLIDLEEENDLIPETDLNNFLNVEISDQEENNVEKQDFILEETVECENSSNDQVQNEFLEQQSNEIENLKNQIKNERDNFKILKKKNFRLHRIIKNMNNKLKEFEHFNLNAQYKLNIASNNVNTLSRDNYQLNIKKLFAERKIKELNAENENLKNEQIKKDSLNSKKRKEMSEKISDFKRILTEISSIHDESIHDESTHDESTHDIQN